MNNKLFDLRMNLKLTQKEISELLNVSLSYYSKIELGIRNPSYNFIKVFKSTLYKEYKIKINIDDIFFGN